MAFHRRALPERPPGVGGDDPDPGQPPWTTHELVARDVGERGGDDLRRGGVRQAERSGHVLAVDDDVHQGVHRRAPRGPALRLGALPQLGNELGGRVAAARRAVRSISIRSKLPRARTAATSTFGMLNRVVSPRWAIRSLTVQASHRDCVDHCASSRSATKVGKGEPLGTDGGLDGGTCEDRVGSRVHDGQTVGPAQTQRASVRDVSPTAPTGGRAASGRAASGASGQTRLGPDVGSGRTPRTCELRPRS